LAGFRPVGFGPFLECLHPLAGFRPVGFGLALKCGAVDSSLLPVGGGLRNGDINTLIHFTDLLCQRPYHPNHIFNTLMQLLAVDLSFFLGLFLVCLLALAQVINGQQDSFC